MHMHLTRPGVETGKWNGVQNQRRLSVTVFNSTFTDYSLQEYTSALGLLPAYSLSVLGKTRLLTDVVNQC